MKTQEELNTLKEEVETLNNKLKELTEDELKSVTGGGVGVYDPLCPYRDIMDYYECNRPLKGSSPICLFACKSLADGFTLPARHDRPEKDSE